MHETIVIMKNGMIYRGFITYISDDGVMTLTYLPEGRKIDLPMDDMASAITKDERLPHGQIGDFDELKSYREFKEFKKRHRLDLRG